MKISAIGTGYAELVNYTWFAETRVDMEYVDADALVIVTEWPEFRTPNFRVIEKLLKDKIIFDGRNIYDPEEMLERLFNYYSIGRQPVIIHK